jgi:hypothetical protein
MRTCRRAKRPTKAAGRAAQQEGQDHEATQSRARSQDDIA